MLLFDDKSTTIKHTSHRWKLYVDGASRNNPGLSGAGVYLVKDDTEVVKQGFFLGKKTNNQAEYIALLLGVYFAQRHMKKGDTILIHADSELLIKQMRGEYRVNNHELKQLHDCIKERLAHLDYNLRHVMREHNTVADKLANLGIDKRLPLPLEIREICSLDEEHS